MNEPSLPEESLLLRALELTSAEEQSTFLERECGDNAELRRGVEDLLRHHREGSGFLESPPTEVVVAGEQLTAAETETPALDFLAPTSEPASIGRLGHYEILEVLGQGGFGVVLKSRDIKLDRIVAIKTLAQSLSSSATARRRFVREAKAAAAVKHDNVVGIYHVADDGPVPYLVMECVGGASLEAKLQQVGTLDLPAILRIGMQIASGLAAAHKQGLVHRDVKPGNILLENGVERVKITDFGLARAADDAAITKTGEVAGTPQYMSPEQAQGLPLDARSDLFSLGSVLYAMATGRSPFRAESTVAALRRVCDDTPRPVREINSDIPDWLEAIINRLLAKQPSERFQTATEVAESLGQYLADVQQSANVPSPKRAVASPRQPSAIRSRQWSVALVALVAMACALGLTEASGVTNVVPTVIHIVRGEGTLVIEVADPTVQVSLDGEELSIRGAGLKELKLVPGKYRLHATKDGQPVTDEVVTITRGGREVAKVTLESSSRADSPSSRPVGDATTTELTLLAKLPGHTNIVHAVSFLPDGKRMVSVDRNTVVRTWDLETRSALSTFGLNLSYCSAADVSADGRFVAIVTTGAERSRTIRVWDVQNRKQICEALQQNVDYLNFIRFSPDGTRVVTSGKPAAGILWDIAAGKAVQGYEVDDSQTFAVEFSPDGRLLAMGVVGRVRLFNVESGKVLGDARLPESHAVISLAFAPSGDSLACGQMYGYTSAIDVNSRQLTATLTDSKSDSPVVSMRFLDNEQLLLTRFNGTCEVWDLKQSRIVATAVSETGTTKRLAVSPDGRYALTAYGERWDEQSKSRKANGDHALRLWQLPASVRARGLAPASSTEENAGGPRVLPLAEHRAGELKLLAKLDGPTDVILAAAFLPDGRRMASVGEDQLVRIWDLPTRLVLSTFPVEVGDPGYADVSADGRLVAGLFWEKSKAAARVWDIEKGNLVCEFKSEWSHGDKSIRFTPDATRLVTTHQRQSYATLWDAATGRELKRFDIGDSNSVHKAAFSPDGRLLAIGTSGRVRLFDVESGNVEADFQLPKAGTICDLIFAPNGKVLATGQHGGKISIIDLDSRRVKTLQASDAIVRSLRFLGSDRFLLTSSYDATLRLWDLEQERVVARAATGNGSQLLFVSPDGRQVITAGGKEWDNTSSSWKDHGDYAPRLWQLPESVWPKTTTGTSPAKELPTVSSEPGAFVLLAAGKERKFDTLGEAVQSAISGDTIEIRGNGPFACQPINLRGPELTIRAGDGFRPVIEISGEGFRRVKSLLRAEGPLVLEGLEFRSGERKPDGWQVLLHTSQSLFAANCRFVSRKLNAHIQADGDAELRNCQFLAPEGYLQSNGTPQLPLAIIHSPGKQLVADNCLLTSAIQTRQGPTSGRSGLIQLTRNTFRTPSSAFRFRVNDGQEDAGDADETEKVLRVEAAGNLFHTRWLFDFGQWRKVALPPVDAEAYVGRIVAWKGERNIYTVADSFLILTQSTPYAVNSPTLPSGLTGWAQLWGSIEQGSLQGHIRCLGGNLEARLAAPEKIAPGDFRLREDSTGYRAGSDGKDLGADVDLVGPGEAYERWKKTPEYQEWLKTTGQEK